MSVLAVVTLALIHPLLFLLCHMLPRIVLRILVPVVGALLIADFMTIRYTARKHPLYEGARVLSENLQGQKQDLGGRMSFRIWQRLNKAYPNLRAVDAGLADSEKGYVFARGICLDKLIWVFFIAALGGDLIETLYVWLTTGILMSRSSVLYGTFSIVWGAGAAILTLVLHGLTDKEDRWIFLAGFFLGGTYEYLCSVLSEVLFGTTFWDYSDMRFNIGGRTNLLFCLFWGILSLIWVKICYPKVSSLIEKIPPLAGKIMTWTFVALMVCDLAISALAMMRYVDRAAGDEADNAVEVFLDEQYPDEFIEWTWPNMNITG